MAIGVLLGAVLGAVEPDAAGSFGFSPLHATVVPSAITATMPPSADFFVTFENVVINGVDLLCNCKTVLYILLDQGGYPHLPFRNLYPPSGSATALANTVFNP
jgi:hypothetical protein